MVLPALGLKWTVIIDLFAPKSTVHHGLAESTFLPTRSSLWHSLNSVPLRQDKEQSFGSLGQIGLSLHYLLAPFLTSVESGSGSEFLFRVGAQAFLNLSNFLDLPLV